MFVIVLLAIIYNSCAAPVNDKISWGELAIISAEPSCANAKFLILLYDADHDGAINEKEYGKLKRRLENPLEHFSQMKKYLQKCVPLNCGKWTVSYTPMLTLEFDEVATLLGDCSVASKIFAEIDVDFDSKLNINEYEALRMAQEIRGIIYPGMDRIKDVIKAKPQLKCL